MCVGWLILPFYQENESWVVQSCCPPRNLVIKVNRDLFEEHYKDKKNNLRLSKAKPYLNGQNVVCWLKDRFGVSNGDIYLWFSYRQPRWPWKVTLLFYTLIPSSIRDMALMKKKKSLLKLYLVILQFETIKWNDSFLRQSRIIPTCWLAPFGRLLLHSDWNPGQCSQLSNKVLLCILHARIKQQSVNTKHIDSGYVMPWQNAMLCYAMTHAMTKKKKGYVIAEAHETVWTHWGCFLLERDSVSTTIHSFPLTVLNSNMLRACMWWRVAVQPGWLRLPGIWAWSFLLWLWTQAHWCTNKEVEQFPSD